MGLTRDLIGIVVVETVVFNEGPILIALIWSSMLAIGVGTIREHARNAFRLGFVCVKAIEAVGLFLNAVLLSEFAALTEVAVDVFSIFFMVFVIFNETIMGAVWNRGKGGEDKRCGTGRGKSTVLLLGCIAVHTGSRIGSMTTYVSLLENAHNLHVGVSIWVLYSLPKLGGVLYALLVLFLLQYARTIAQGRFTPCNIVNSAIQIVVYALMAPAIALGDFDRALITRREEEEEEEALPNNP